MTAIKPRPRSLTTLLLGAALALVARPAPAQEVDPDEYAARAAARVALIDLRTQLRPGPDDYLVAASVLETAGTFQPEDPELLRMRIRAAWAAGDEAAVDDLTRRLIVLDPSDTVAQLRLASARIRRLQTIEERLAAYDRLLGPAGAKLDPAVRSRLALDAALLYRERNDLNGFVQRLTQALQLDSTHKEAAALAWSYFGPQVGSRSQRFELLLNLLAADPTDPNIHRQIANELALGGAFAQARRFHDRAIRLFTAMDPRIDDRLAIESAVISWQVEGPEAVVAALNQRLAIMREQAAAQILQWQQARMPTDSLPKPEEVMLQPAYNQMRLVAAIMADDRETIGRTLTDMGAVFTQMMAQAQQLTQLSTQEERLQKSAELWNALSQQLIAVAWADASTESLTQWADRAEQDFGADAEAAKSLRGWAELRLGDPAEAERVFRGASQQALLNRVGLAITLEELGRTEEANEILRELAQEQPLSLSGVWARDRYRNATGEDPLATPDQAMLNRLAMGVPSWVDRMTMDPRSFMAFHAELEDSTLPATGRAGVRIRITNLAPVPLGVGGDRTLNSRLLFAPRLDVGASLDLSKALPEVAELDRRLRLMPAESIEVVVWPDPGVIGWIAETAAIETVRQRWRVLQGYTLDAMGVPAPGVLCFETETGSLIRTPLELGRVPATELATALESASQAELPGVVAAIRARALLHANSPYAVAGDDLARIASIAAERYPLLPPVARATMLAVLPTANTAPDMRAFDAVALAEESDEAVLPLALVSRVANPDHAALQRALQHESERVRSLARALEARLRSPRMTFSRLTADDLRAAPAALGERE